jgi:hypothetical protein
MKKYRQLLTSDKVAGEVKQAQFFNNEHANGYMSKQDFLDYSRSLSQGQQDQLDLFFEYTEEQFEIISLPIESEDKETGEVVIWVKFRLPGTPQTFRMIFHPGLLQFIKDCQQRKIKPSFTFDQLIEEALTVEHVA